MSSLHVPTIPGLRASMVPAVRSFPGVGLLTLAAGMVVSTLMGPLGLGIIRFAVSEGAETQLIGGEIATVVLAIPLATVAGVLWLRGHRLAPVLAIGPGIYAAYMYAQYALAPDLSRYEGNSERAFPLYLLLVLGGWLIAARSWRAIRALDLPDPGRPGRVTGTLLLALNTLFALAWIASIAPIVAGRDPGAAYLADPTLFWTVRLMDLGFVIPVGMGVAIALLRRHPVGTNLVYAWHGAQTLLVFAVCGMAWLMHWRNDPESDPVFLVATSIITLGFVVVAGALWRRATRPTAIVTIS